MQATKKKERLPISLKIGYGMGSLGENVAYNVFYTFFLLYMTNYAGVNAGIAGTIALVAVLWDGVIGLLAGYTSDRSKNPRGRRRPFIQRFAVPFGIMCCVLFTNIGLTGGAQIAYIIIMNILFWLFFELTDVPYLTLGSELTDDPNEKTSLRSWSTMLNYVGYLIACSFTMQLVNRIGDAFGGNYNLGWTITTGIFGAIIIITYFSVAFVTKGKDSVLTKEKEESLPEKNILQLILDSMKVKPYMKLWLYNALFNTAIFACTSTTAYLIYYVCGGNDNNLSVITSIYAVFVIILSPIVTKISERIDSRLVLIFTALIGGALLAIFYVAPLTTNTMLIMMLGVAVGMAGYFVISYSMLYECLEVSPLKVGYKNDGMMVAFYQFGQKFGGAFGMWLAGQIMNAYGYDALNVTETAVYGIRLTGTLVAGGIAFLAAIVILFYGLKRTDLMRLRDIQKAPTLNGEDKAFIMKKL